MQGTHNNPQIKSEPLLNIEQGVALTVLITGVVLAVLACGAMFSFTAYSPLALVHFFAPLTFKGSVAIGFFSLVVIVAGSALFYVASKRRSDQRLEEESKRKNDSAIVSTISSKSSELEPSPTKKEIAPPPNYLAQQVQVDTSDTLSLNVGASNNPSSQNVNKTHDMNSSDLQEPPALEETKVWQKNMSTKVSASECNLENPYRPIAPLAFRYNKLPCRIIIQTPQMGVYKVEGYEFDNVQLTVRLHPDQAKYLPKSVQTALNNEKPTDFFLQVFTPTSATKKSPKRNISLHAMAIPEYDMKLGLKNFPADLKDVHLALREKEEPDLNDVDVFAQVGLWEASGLLPTSHLQSSSPKSTQYLEIDKVKKQDICIHFDCFSPDDCAIRLDQTKEASTFIVTATFRERRVVFVAIYLHECKMSFESRNFEDIYQDFKSASWCPKWLERLFE